MRSAAIGGRDKAEATDEFIETAAADGLDIKKQMVVRPQSLIFSFRGRGTETQTTHRATQQDDSMMTL